MKNQFFVLSLLSLLTTCGGSSSSSTSTTPKPPVIPTPPESCDPVLPNQPVDASAHWQNYLATRTCTGLYNGEYNGDDGTEVLPDFSYAGYQYGDESYTSIDRSGFTTYDVLDHGLIADDGISDKAKLKALIAKVSADKLSGAVNEAIIHFPKGRYILNDATDAAQIDAALAGLAEGSAEYAEIIKSQQPIFITDSHIILQGAGVGESILYSSEPLLPEVAENMWTTPYLVQITSSSATSATTAITSLHERGTTKTISIADAAGFSVGDSVELVGTSTQLDAVATLVSPYQLEKKSNTEDDYVWTQLTGGVKQVEKHIISAISGDLITFNAPVLHAISADYTWNLSKVSSLTQIGVEGLTFQGNWQTPFVHHGSAAHDSGFSMLQLSRVNNSWVSHIEVNDFNQGLSLKNSFNVTVEDVDLTGTAGHTAVSVQVSNNNLLKNITDTTKTWHAAGLSNYTVGNVYLNIEFDKTASNDLHGVQSMYNLFDEMTGGFVYSRWGASSQNQPNHLQGLIYWNPVNTSDDSNTNSRFQYMNSTSQYGRVIMPYIIGMTGNSMTFASQYAYSISTQSQFSDYQDPLPVSQPQAFVESMGTAVYPASLYEAQLQFRQSLVIE